MDNSRYLIKLGNIKPIFKLKKANLVVFDLNLFIYSPSCLKLYAFWLQIMVIVIFYVSIAGKLKAGFLQEIKLQDVKITRQIFSRQKIATNLFNSKCNFFLLLQISYLELCHLANLPSWKLTDLQSYYLANLHSWKYGILQKFCLGSDHLA